MDIASFTSGVQKYNIEKQIKVFDGWKLIFTAASRKYWDNWKNIKVD